MGFNFILSFCGYLFCFLILIFSREKKGKKRFFYVVFRLVEICGKIEKVLMLEN